jgi:hypothetical protein
MAKKPSILKDEEILAKVSAQSQNSVNWFDSRLSKERERVTLYLNGDLPKRTSTGSSSYVSSDVYDSVQMMTSQLLEVFAGGEQIAQFDPDADMDIENCRIATECARYVIFRDNGGYNIFNSVIYDGLTARAGICKVYWEEKYKTTDEEFEGLSEEDAMALVSQDEVSDFDATEQPDGSYAGTLTRKKDVSRVCIDPVAPEEFLINAMATSIWGSNYVGHRTPKTRAELIDMGYDKDIVRALPADDARELQFSPEVLSRTRKTATATSRKRPRKRPSTSCSTRATSGCRSTPPRVFGCTRCATLVARSSPRMRSTRPRSLPTCLSRSRTCSTATTSLLR